MTMKTEELITALQAAAPGQALDIGEHATVREMDRAVAHLNKLYSQGKRHGQVAGLPNFDLGPHIKVYTEFWGVIVEIDHEAMGALQKGGATGALVAVGVNAIAAAIIAGVIAIWSAFDKGRGVKFYVTWLGVHWFVPL